MTILLRREFRVSRRKYEVFAASRPKESWACGPPNAIKKIGSATTPYGTAAPSFVIPSKAEGSAVPRTFRGNAEFYLQTKLSSRPERSAVERSAVFLTNAVQGNRTGAPRSPKRTPDFLSNLLALANFMRLSLMKATRGCWWRPAQEIRIRGPKTVGVSPSNAFGQ
jgi:hypothetical protein